MSVPIYQQISPDKAKIMNMNRVLGESVVQNLSEYARQASIELYSIRDEQEKINQIYRFLYYYLLSYNYSDIPAQNTSKPETLQKEHQELIEKSEEVKLMETNEQLIQQLKIQKTMKRAKALEEKKALETERDKRQQEYDTIKEQYEKAFRSSQDSVGSITALEEQINSLEQQLHQKQEENQKLEQELKTLRAENKELKEKFEELNSQYINLLMQSEL